MGIVSLVWCLFACFISWPAASFLRNAHMLYYCRLMLEALYCDGGDLFFNSFFNARPAAVISFVASETLLIRCLRLA